MTRRWRLRVRRTQTAMSLSGLNLGQTVIITAGLIGVMVMAAQGVRRGR